MVTCWPLSHLTNLKGPLVTVGAVFMSVVLTCWAVSPPQAFLERMPYCRWTGAKGAKTFFSWKTTVFSSLTEMLCT